MSAAEAGSAQDGLPAVVERLRAQDFLGAARAAEGALAQSPGHPDLLHLLGLARRHLGQIDSAIGALEQAAAADPRRASFHFNLGQVYAARGSRSAAIDSLLRALTLDPGHLRARYELACLWRAQRDLDRAERELRACLAKGADDARIHVELTATLLDRGRPDLVLPVAKAGLVLAPELAALHTNLGNALRDIGRPKQAIASYDRALGLAPDSIEIRLNRAMALLRAGRLAEGFPAYEVRLAKPGMVRQALAALPAWDGSFAPAGRTLLLHGEQGHGDSIQFIRYAALARRRGARVLVECQHRLYRLFAGQGDGLADQVFVRDREVPPCDARASLLSMPALMQTDLMSIPAATPYLRPVPGVAFDLPPAPAAARLKLGLVWSGNPGHQQDHLRSCPLSVLAPVLALPDIAIYPLQLEIDAAERAQLAASPSVVFLDHPQADFADAAAAMMQLDLIISVDTATAHLAGALGRPGIVLLSQGADWRWMVDRDDSPWYPSLTLIRQARPGDWAGVARRLVERLRATPGTPSPSP
ncbi:MAG: glycosyltransferase family protein [Alphaproteobacteria bacterium]|nr:glycosyltransferase family protein [Alphaproteobacteria bacterium]